VVAVTSVNAAAVFAASAIAGWILTWSWIVETSAVLESYRWPDGGCAVAVVTSALDRVHRRLWLYRVFLSWARGAGRRGRTLWHGALAWGADFLRPRAGGVHDDK
jgi:hypothetical protein